MFSTSGKHTKKREITSGKAADEWQVNSGMFSTSGKHAKKWEITSGKAAEEWEVTSGMFSTSGMFDYLVTFPLMGIFRLLSHTP